MRKRSLLLAGVAVAASVVGYLTLWPVPVDPQPWTAPPNPGYSGPFARNERLAGLEVLSIAPHHGPEDVAFDDAGRLVASTHEGLLLRMNPDGSNIEVWADTGGRPLGIDFHPNGTLMVADGFRGLLAVHPDGKVEVLADTADGVPIDYADDVAVADDGKVYFTDATTRFGAEASGGTYEGSLLDLMEHGRTGRVLVYDPETRATTTVADGFSFANGIAVSQDQQSVVVNETGEYRTWRIFIAGPDEGTREILIEHLPSFPDNVTRGRDGRLWIALVAPRNPILDGLADKPFVRKVIQRLPAFMRPAAEAYGHVIAVDANGKVVQDLQDPAGTYPVTTTAVETDDYLYIGSLVAPGIGRKKKSDIGL